MKASGSGRKPGASLVSRLRNFLQLSLFDLPPQSPAAHPGKAATEFFPPQVITGKDHFPANPASAIADNVSRAPAALFISAATEKYPTFEALCRGPYGHIQVTVRKRLWESWRVSWTRRYETLRMEVPASLIEAPLQVKEALLQWALVITRRASRKQPDQRALRSRLEGIVREYLHGFASDDQSVTASTASSLQKRRLARNRRKVERLEPQGRFHNLDLVFADINRIYFAGKLEAKLTWSARLGGLSTHSIARDGEGRPYHLISISRGYDNADVTPEILGGVVYHESLHIAIPPREKDGRRIVHGPEFRKREREYSHYEVWRRWHRDGLPKAIRNLKRARR